MSNRYYYYTTVNETLSELCKSVSCSAQEIIKINTQQYDKTKTVGQVITDSQILGTKLPSGMSVRIPYPVTGGKEIDYTNYEISNVSEILNQTDYDTSDVSELIYDDPYKVKGIVREAEAFEFTLETPTAPKGLSTVSDSWKSFNCYITVYSNRSPVSPSAFYLPVYPQEFSDTNEASFGQTDIFGRSVPYQTYNGSGRSVSLTLQLHEELCTDYDYIHKLVSFVESSCYPNYSSNQVQVPEIGITIGKQFNCRGIITSCSATWKAPIIDGRYVNCDLSIGIKETTGPYSMSQVAKRYATGDKHWMLGGRYK